MWIWFQMFMLFSLLLWPQSGKTQVLTPPPSETQAAEKTLSESFSRLGQMPQWMDPFSVPFERLGQRMGEHKKYVRPADPVVIATVKKNDPQRLLQQIDAGSDLEVRDAYGYTALMWAAAEGKGAIAWILLGAGADINAGTADGTTALMRAAIYGHTDIVRFFLEQGADVEANTASGATALSRASDRRLWHMGGKQHAEVVTLLTQAGAAQRTAP